jgi:hypothetical protein
MNKFTSLIFTKQTIIFLVTSTLCILGYFGFEIFWTLSPSLNILEKKVTQVPSTFNLELVEKVWLNKDLKTYDYNTTK